MRLSRKFMKERKNAHDFHFKVFYEKSLHAGSEGVWERRGVETILMQFYSGGILC